MLDTILADISPWVFFVNLLVFDDQPKPHVLNVLHTPTLESLPCHVFDADAPFLFLIFFFRSLCHLLLQLLNGNMRIRCWSATLSRILLSFCCSGFCCNFFRFGVDWYTGRARHSRLELNQAAIRHVTTPDDWSPFFLYFSLVKFLATCNYISLSNYYYLACCSFCVYLFHHLDSLRLNFLLLTNKQAILR